MPNTKRHHLLAILLHELEAAGYPLGPAKYLQVQELLRQAPADLDLEHWRGLLAPLFSSSQSEQQQFYALFDKSLELVNKLHLPEPDSAPVPPTELQELEKKETRWRRVIYILTGILLAVLLGWLIFAQLQKEKPASSCSSSRTERLSIAPGDTASMTLRLPADTSKLLRVSPRDWQVSSRGGLFKVDSSGQATYIASSTASVGSNDTMLVFLEDAQCRDTVYWIIDIIAKPKPIAQDTGLIAELPLPYPKNDTAFASLRIDEKAQKRYEDYQRWQWPAKALLLLLLGLLARAIVYWDQTRRAKAVAELKRPDRAPYLWNPETGVDATEFLRNDAAPLLTRLRGRSFDERLRLDLAATVQSSIRAGGRIHLRYRRQTLPPDFLLLIDRHDAQDHRARLFEALYQVFLRAEAPVSRYFYDGDPRLCFDEAHPGGIALSELLHRHAGAQLLLLGEGQGLLSTQSGRVATWTSLLQAWPRRALLLTRPMQAWGRREKELQALLPLVPASPAGLGAAIDLFNAEDPTTLNPDLLKAIPDALQKPFEFGFELLPDLQRHFSTPYVDWIAACALWPTLHWDLTLHLGKVLDDLGNGDNGQNGQNSDGSGQAGTLLHFAGIRELTRLPWFVEGRIPDAARATLIEYLQQRGLEQPLRRALRELLQQTPPPPAEASAYDDYRMSLILNELFLRPDKARKRELEREFERYLAAGKKPDFVALKLLNRPQTPLDVLVGDRLKKHAFKEGMPGLGWQLLPKLLGIWIVLGLGVVLFKPFANPCAGEKVEYQSQIYCLQDTRDQLLYLEQLAADAIGTQAHARVDSLLVAADALKARDSAFYLNTATRYYNQGAEFFNCSRQPDCSALPPDSLRKTACLNFAKGEKLDSSIMKKTGVQYYLAQQRSCGLVQVSGTNPAPDTARFVLQGRVLDALTQSPIVGAQVRLGGQRSSTRAGGTYRFTVRASTLGNSLELRASANDYEPGLLRTSPQNTLPDLRLSPSNAALERAAWARAVAANTPAAYTAYLEAFPNGPNATEARKRIAAAVADAASTREQSAWTEAQRLNSIAGYENFLREFSASVFAPEAQKNLANLRDDASWASAQTANTPAACQQYLNSHPNGRHVEAARQCANPPPPKVDVPRPAMVRIPAGSFEMGDQFRDGDKSELPVHNVRLDAFEIGRYEVTFAEYDLFCEATKTPKPEDEGWGRGIRPVINVSWEDVVAYCNWLSEQHGYQPVYSIKGSAVTVNSNANGYCLPTEAEWEYAARGGGKKVRFGNGKDVADPTEINFNGSKDYKEKYSVVGEYRGKTVPVASLKSPNALGLHDMSGNVWEWCWDWYDENYYGKSPTTNPQGPASGDRRVLRGGSWNFSPINCRASFRVGVNPDYRGSNFGFRLARY